MWTQNKMYYGASGTRSLPALFVTPGAIMFSPTQGNEISEILLTSFTDENDLAFASCILGGLVPVQVTQRKEGLSIDIRKASAKAWDLILEQFQGITKTESKIQILCRIAHEYLPSEKTQRCARLFGVFSTSLASRPKYFDELAQLWSPILESEEELLEVINNLVSHGMCEIDPQQNCVRIPIPLVRYYRSLLSIEESMSIYNRFLSPRASTLHKAALHDYTELAKHILSKNSLPKIVDARDEGNWTPLLFAAQNASYDVIRLLIEHGANVNAVENTNQTPLHRACFSGSLNCVKLLVDNGAAINHAEVKGITPVVIALGHRFKEIVDYLLLQGALIPIENKALYDAYIEDIEDEEEEDEQDEQ